MSDLTEEFLEATLELADELGEGLTATLIEADLDTYDPGEGRLSGGGVPPEHTFKIPPPERSSETAAGDDDEVTATTLAFVMPRTKRSDGTVVIPDRGMLLRFKGKLYGIGSVQPLGMGDDFYAYRLEVEV